MTSPSKDTGLPLEPSSGSPVTIRRRSSISASEVSDLTTRPRHSPTVPRSFDPDARERQRTMDVDMAIHLSRARRETVHPSPNTSPFEITQSDEQLAISALSEHEEHQIDIARGEILHETASPTSQSSLIDLNSPLHQIHDPVLTLSPQTHSLSPIQDSESISGLPVYQDNVYRTDFDFSPMEQFAAVEKATLGLTSAPSTKFSLSALRQTRSRARASTSYAPPPQDDDPVLNDQDATITPTPANNRHRKLSESNPNPRIPHRRGIGGKIALFEGSPNYPSSPHTQDNFFAPSSSLYQTAPPPTMTGTGTGTGILHIGHDRPYRFSFYSNTLAATIHARSLSELPADGQTFEELFSGISSGNEGGHGVTSLPSLQNSRPGTALGINKGTTTMNNSLDSNYFNHGTFSRRTDSKGALAGGGGGGNGKYEADGDSDAKMWWLDIQSPTDEEMKMLSKVNLVLLYGF